MTLSKIKLTEQQQREGVEMAAPARLSEATYQRGRTDERARIVAYLRQFWYESAADAIERGLHLKKQEGR